MSVTKFRRKLRQLKALTANKPHGERTLRLLAEMRALLPDHVAPPRQPEEVRTRAADGMRAETEEDFECAAVADGIESLADEVSSVVAQKQAALMETLLRVYYATEEASHDPANAHLIEHVERMRAAYERAYGRPIPPDADAIER
jgi:hypothetical protein